MKKYFVLAVSFILLITVPACAGSSSTTGISVNSTAAVTNLTTLSNTSALTATSQSPAGLAAKSGDSVKVDYTGTLQDGTVFGTSIGKTPLEFTIGDGTMLPGFNAALVGMVVGESKTFTLLNPYGDYNQSLVVTVPKTQFAPGLNPTVGQQLKVTHQDGSTGTVVVVAVNDTTITVDGNSPLAGKTLTFNIKLLSITPKN
jgi:peptidylprolyl isomerase